MFHLIYSYIEENGEVFLDSAKIDFSSGQLVFTIDSDGETLKAYFDKK
jgi:hypothetical protein